MYNHDNQANFYNTAPLALKIIKTFYDFYIIKFSYLNLI